MITGLPVARPKHAIATFYVRWKLSSVLQRILGPKFATKLELR